MKYKPPCPIIFKDTKRNRVCLGGLGPFGVGIMWVNKEPQHELRDGYVEAPEHDSWQGFGTPEFWEKNPI
jgi:hypothetical protein